MRRFFLILSDPTTDLMSAYSRPLLLLLILFAAWIVTDGIGVRKLANPDEGRYSEISREMAVSGDFVTPRLNALKYFEKPPMQYWASAIAFKAFGEGEFSARLYISLCALACLLLVFYTGGKLFDWQTGLYATLALIGMPFFMGMAHVVTLDMGLTFWITLSVCAYMLAQTEPPPYRQRWLWTFWLSMAGGALSKGPIGVVLPAAAVFLYAFFPLDLRRWLRLDWLRGLILFFLAASPWFVMVSLRNSEFAYFFFIHENLDRYLTTTHRRVGEWWYFVPILLLGVLPWVAAMFPAIYRGWQQPGIPYRDEAPFRPLRFLLLFSAFVFVFFSMSGSKLPHYILPVFPALALVIGVWFKAVDGRKLAWLILPVAPLMLAVAYWAWGYPATREDAITQKLYGEVSGFVVSGAVALAVLTAAAFFLLIRNASANEGRKWLAVLLVSVGSLTFIECFNHGAERISALKSSYGLAQAVAPRMTPQTRLYSVHNYEQALPFYLKRTMTLVDYVDEFELGQHQEPNKYLPKVADFLAAWNAPGPAIAIIQPSDVAKLSAEGLAFEVIHEDPVRVAILKK